jgi:hypothetical protein
MDRDNGVEFAAKARWRRICRINEKWEQVSMCGGGLPIDFSSHALNEADAVPFMRSREAGPIQRIVARAIDAYQVEFASRFDHEADQPSTYETRNRCNVSLHGMPTVNQREHPLDRERRECALTAINDMSFRSVVRNWS